MANEPWAFYNLPDGTQIRAKAVITNIFRLDGDLDHEGHQNYYVRHTLALTTSPPQEFSSDPMTGLQ